MNHSTALVVLALLANGSYSVAARTPIASGTAGSGDTLGKRGLAPSIHSIAGSADAQVIGYRFRVVSPLSGVESTPTLFRDGIGTIRICPEFVVVDELCNVLETEQASGRRVFVSERTANCYSLTSGEFVSWQRLGAGARPDVLLSLWTSLPRQAFLLCGHVEPRYSDVALEVESQAGADGSSMQRGRFAAASGVSGTIAWHVSPDGSARVREMSYVGGDGNRHDLDFMYSESQADDRPTVVVERTESDGVLTSVSTWMRVELPSEMESAPRVEPGDRVMDLRAEGERVSSVTADRSMTLDELSRWRADATVNEDRVKGPVLNRPAVTQQADTDRPAEPGQGNGGSAGAPWTGWVVAGVSLVVLAVLVLVRAKGARS